MSLKEFSWGVGFEGSFIPQLGVNQYEWTQHNANWRTDFKLVADEIGCRSVRYPLPWHEIEIRPGRFEWGIVDERLDFAEKNEIDLIVDLVHFGTPKWLVHAFGDIDFPHALERFAAAFGERYAGRIPMACPLNEPTTTALFCGELGHWPPHGKDLRTFTTVLARTVEGLGRAINALRQTVPGIRILCTEPLDYAFVGEGEPAFLEADAAWRNTRRHLALDLLTGRVNENHPLYSWLVDHGFSPFDLKWFVSHPAEFDVLGVDYYPHTEVELYATDDGHCKQRTPDLPRGLVHAATGYWERYRKPLIVAETSVTGSDDDRIAWLRQTVTQVRALRQARVPVLGYYWWPMIDHLDWDGALLHRTGHIHPVGLYRLQLEANGQLSRNATRLGSAYRELVHSGCTEVGGEMIWLDFQSQDECEKNNFDRGLALVQSTASHLDHPLVVHSHLRWNWVWQRPQQFLSRLSKRRRILFVEGPVLVDDNCSPTYSLHDCADYPNVTIMQTTFPRSRFSDGEWVDAERLRLLRHALSTRLRGQFDNPVQWFYDPMAVTAFAGALNERAIVYDCMDQLSQFKFAPPELVDREAQLLRRADLVFAGGRKLWEAKRLQNPNCHFYGCGVDVEHFGKARDGETVVPFDLDFLPRPILGYIGVVDERLDYELIANLAQYNPEWSIAMIGPVCKVDPNRLPRPRNVYWLGGRDYANLPKYAKGFDVSLMPFILNESTEFINPTKALEYMATGKPIVSTAVADVVSNFGDLLTVAHSHPAFVEACTRAIAQPDHAILQQAIQHAEVSSWESIVCRLEDHLADALRKNELPTLSPITEEFVTAA